MRLFLAIEMPAEVKEILSTLRRDIHGVRWVPPEQLHLTLLFLGELAPENLDRLCTTLATIAIAPFSLTFDRTGCFPRPAAPRILWAGIIPHPVLSRLVLLVREAAADCGVIVDEKPFSPHITLARIKHPKPCPVTGFTGRPITDKKLPVPVDRFILYQSTLTSQGAIHEAVRAFRLAAPPHQSPVDGPADSAA